MFRELIDCLKTLHPSYASREQQDANEFLVRVIEKMHSQLPEGPENPVEAHFQWELVEILRCTKYKRYLLSLIISLINSCLL